MFRRIWIALSNLCSRVNLEWTKPEAEAEKILLSGKNVGDTINDYLWFELGDIDTLREEEVKAIDETFFVDGRGTSFGNIELHRSEGIPGNPTLLRLRGSLRFLPSLVLRGRYCPLYQIGHYDWGTGSPGSINFHTHWNPTTVSG